MLRLQALQLEAVALGPAGELVERPLRMLGADGDLVAGDLNR
ncbi:MAG: hypothetical protein ACR2IN_09470 [Thermoleophilaceae bacterium]